MSPTWKRTAIAPPIDGELFMDAELRPHRSLSLQAFRWMLAAMIAINAIGAVVFISQGAFPVAGFLGLDVLALWLAFRMNYNAGRTAEYVRIGAGRVHVASVKPDSAVTHWTLNPIWARVARDGPGVLIRDGDGQLRIGAFLSPKECDAFAQALSLALFRAKRGG
jgi:uncharacterized membrane protein